MQGAGVLRLWRMTRMVKYFPFLKRIKRTDGSEYVNGNKRAVFKSENVLEMGLRHVIHCSEDSLLVMEAAGKAPQGCTAQTDPMDLVLLQDLLDGLYKASALFWLKWIGQRKYTRRWRKVVYRSAPMLKLLTYQPTGAAPTYIWIRESAFTIDAFVRIGLTEEVEPYMQFMQARMEELKFDGSLQVIYFVPPPTNFPIQPRAPRRLPQLSPRPNWQCPSIISPTDVCEVCVDSGSEALFWQTEHRLQFPEYEVNECKKHKKHFEERPKTLVRGMDPHVMFNIRSLAEERKRAEEKRYFDGNFKEIGTSRKHTSEPVKLTKKPSLIVNPSGVTILFFLSSNGSATKAEAVLVSLERSHVMPKSET
ncbi:hypothetical protein HK097_008713 [Rhizophlyctis rosea]|uniref:Uncharacterized protein n=1 Tax=Rhizophlyctis rosea TaxID=64517 RepID=A0AAD5X0X4_9FUNG|nr:hypothetical protein HK097_008713 [Rhizophlyctis rosea]